MHDLACVVHLHSLHSDGTGSVAEIARAGARAGVDVVLLTDHDTLAARREGEEGWYGDVLLLAGEEVSPARANHLLAFGVEDEIDHEGLDGEAIARAVRDAGGLGFAAHPWSSGPRRFRRRGGTGMPFGALDSEALTGVELWSFVTDTVEGLESVPRMLLFVLSPLRVLDHPPAGNVAAWEALCRERRSVAIGGLDAHQFGVRIGRVVFPRLMAYRRSFRHLRTHVLTGRPLRGELGADRAAVFAALGEGRCYLALDSIAPARGFRFEAGDVPMGAEAPAGRHTLRARTPLPCRMRLLRDGAEIAVSEGTALEHEVGEPGVYRIEARRRARGRERTWIISNPVYLRS